MIKDIDRTLAARNNARVNRIYLENLAANLDSSRLNPPVAGILTMRDAHKKQPCVIIAPGPSAAGVLEAARQEHEEGMLTIALNRAWQKVPWVDMVIADSPSEGIAPFLRQPKDVTRWPLLVAASTIHPKAIANWGGPVCFYHKSNPDCPSLQYANCEQHTLPIGRLDDIGFTGLQAIQFADYIGCGRIHLVGYDYCFYRGWFDFHLNATVADIPVEKLIQFGKEKYTSDTLYAEAMMFTARFLNDDKFKGRIYNASSELWEPYARFGPEPTDNG